MTFSEAIANLADGKQVRREGWNVDEYISLGFQPTYVQPNTRLVIMSDYPCAVYHNKNINYAGWTPTQADMFSEDWIVI